jgi:hypothetical protein
MATFYARTEFRKNNGGHSRVQFNTYALTEACNVQGGVDGVWEIDSAGAFDVVVEDYDKSHFAEYPTPPNKPYVIFSCDLDKTGGTTLIKDEAGNTLYTFSGDYSVHKGYCVLVLDVPTTGKYTWKLA